MSLSVIQFRGKPLWALLSMASLALLFSIAFLSGSAQASLSPASAPLAPAAQLQDASNVANVNQQQNVSPNGVAGGCASGYSYATSSGTIVPGTTDIGNHCDDCTT